MIFFATRKKFAALEAENKQIRLDAAAWEKAAVDREAILVKLETLWKAIEAQGEDAFVSGLSTLPAALDRFKSPVDRT